MRSKAIAWLWIRQRQRQVKKQPQHLSYREEATWLMLLRQLNDMENASTAWVDEHHKQTDWVKKQDENNVGDPNPPTFLPRARHTLVVALQPIPCSWDNMPAGAKRPYAISVICHIVEIAAMLRIHWKEFDRSRDKYRAEGNGYLLTGSAIPDLGLCFTFRLFNKPRFRENRIIPVDGIKSLCFGYVPTIFQNREDIYRLDAKDPDELQLGSMPEIAETMVQLGCDMSTANYMKTTDAVHQHLFAGTLTLSSSPRRHC